MTSTLLSPWRGKLRSKGFPLNEKGDVMKRISTIAIAVAAMLALTLGLAACSGDGASSASSSASASASTSSSSSASSSSNAKATSTASSSASKATSSSAAASANGKQTATGTVVTTTYAERAAEVGLSGDDYKNDTGLLTLLVLDAPMQVTAYKGGSDYTGTASVIRLPNDEMFRQFSGKQITISVDSWGEWPADLSGKLYDLVVDFDSDGLGLVE